MALLTMIARVIDGLPLVGTMQDDEQVSFKIYLIFKTNLKCILLKERPQYYGISKSSQNVIS